MEVQYKSSDGRYVVKFNANEPKDLFKQIADFEEVFGNNLTCRNCDSNETRLSVRVIDDNAYYERVCNKCGFKFSFGQHKKGGSLFPKYDKGNHGWHKWTPEDAEGDEVPAKKGKK